MDPIIDSDWLGCKNEPPDESHSVGNFARSWQWREMGINPAHTLSNKTVMQNIAEDVLVQKQLKIKSCDLPGFPRSTFLMVFSPDGTKVASTHGNHNVYVSELASGKHVRILKGHPRTPWCIAFHPSHPQLIGSGCLGGQVRVWDLSGGSEVWRVDNETVIASIAFHPRDQLLVIATFNELYFWDWSQPAPFTKVCTNNINEKVRYVAFDSLGYKLITGISVWATPGGSNSLLQNISHGNSPSNQSGTRSETTGDGGPGNRNQEGSGTAQEMIVNSYQNLVQRYDSLVRNYQRLFMARHQLTSTPLTNTTDRGTDPMETDTSLGPGSSNWNSRTAGASGARERNNDAARRQEGGDSGDGEGSSRLLNLDVLSINSFGFGTSEHPKGTANSAENVTIRLQSTQLDFADTDSLDDDRSTDGAHSTPISEFGSRSSAFQRFLHDNPGRLRNVSPIVGPAERTTRWLPNPFSSSSNPPARSNTVTFSTNTQPTTESNAGSSRTSVFTSHRFDSSAASFFAYRRRNMAHSQNSVQTSTNTSPPTTVRASPNRDEPRTSERPRTSRSTGSQRPTMTNSSTQISPVAAQTINESLDLIRDILRDSGTRLLNLITNMSLSTLASVERSIPRRHHASHSDDSEGARPRHQRPRIRLFSSSLRREFLSSESDSDSDHSLQVNLARTRNPSYQEEGTEPTNSNNESRNQPTDRIVVELDINDDAPNEENESNRRFNVSVSNNSRFRVRSHSTDENRSRDGPNRERRGARNDDRSQNSSASVDPSRPSTSRDNYWMDDVLNMSPEGLSSRPNIPSDEAFRKVRAGVNALHKHTVHLTDMWLRGSRTSMRDLRAMWENLRRRVLSLHRQTGRTDVPSYYTRGLMERCRFLTEMIRSPRSSPNRSARAARTNRNTEDPVDDRHNEDSQQTQMSTDSTSSSMSTHNDQSTSAGTSTGTNRTRPSARRASQLANLYSLYKLSARRRLQSGYRWRADEEARRRARGSPASRWCLRHGGRPGRRDNARSFELHCTRNEIRVRAMQVLSIMFNMMMSCLEERGLSQLIIHMLRTLKKALALTCLMLMTNRLNRRENEATAAANDETPNANESENSQEPEEPPPENNQTTENVEEPAEENMNTQEQAEANTADNADRANDSNSTSSWPTSDSDDDNRDSNKNKETPQKPESEPSTSQINTEPDNIVISIPSPEPAPHPWSNRLAVQISAANRNYSATARNRRDIYLEIRRQKALHRTNPGANPITRRKMLPPASTYRIPEVRSLPVKKKSKAVKTLEAPSSSDEPVAGPSNAQPGPSTENNSSSPREPGTSRMNEAEHRVNMFRIAHMHAVRLRTAARTRLRRLQTIRLYTPSSVREMFAIQSNNNDNQSGQPLLNYASDLASRRQAFHAYRPHILATRNEGNREGSQQFESILNNVAVPLVQVNDLPVESQGPQPQRMPRVHDYLQPIILAQNALVVEDNGGGGGAGAAGGPPMPPIPPGLFEAGLVSEALPAPTHRVQAWDFTTGDTPDIADSAKNVVVQRCRIHNDASIDISKDGRLLVALLPVPRLRHTSHWLGVYSLEWGRLGQCLHTAVLEQSAVSVALSPTARHLAVGLGSRRFTTLPHARNNVFALLYRLEPLESSSRTGLSPIKELEQNWEHGFTSLNCLRWAPQPGQGLVYANNTGQLIIMS